MSPETKEEPTAAEIQQEVDAQKAEANLAGARAEGEAAMELAKRNHPEVDWQADATTGAPLVPGMSDYERPENMKSPEPVEVNPDGTINSEQQNALAADQAAAAKAEPAKAKTETK